MKNPFRKTTSNTPGEDVPGAQDVFTPKRTFLLADCEGALGRIQLSLRCGGLVDDDNTWCAPAGTLLVQLGDMIDRGNQSIASILYMLTLSQAASTSGSKVVMVLGNHELLAIAAGAGDQVAALIWSANGGTDFMADAELEGWAREDVLLGRAYANAGGRVAVRNARPSLDNTGMRDAQIWELAHTSGAYVFGGLTSTKYMYDPTGRLVTKGETILSTLMPGRLTHYVKQVEPFYQNGSSFFVHGGVSAWFINALEDIGSLTDISVRLKEAVQDPFVRTHDPLLRSFVHGIGRARGGDASPFHVSPAWVDWDKEQKFALQSEELMELLLAQGVHQIFCGHTPGNHPRQLSVNRKGAPVKISLPDQATRTAQSISVALTLFCLDCGLRRDPLKRPHLYEWDEEMRTLRFYANDSVLQA